MSNFKRRITRIAGTALLPAALAVGVGAVPASAQQSPPARPAVAAAHAGSQKDHGYYAGWQDTGYGFYSYDECYRYGYEYYPSYQFKCVYTYSNYYGYYWELWVYYPTYY